MKLNVLYEDNHLIAVEKPAGMLVQGDETGDVSLMDEVKDYLKKRYQKPGNVFLGLIHRLDRPVSGIVLFAKTSKGASRLSEQFRNHTVEKTYHAWVEGIPKEKSATLIHYLKKDDVKNKTSVFEKEAPGSQYAKLSYELLKTEGEFSLLKITLDTGRPHQIRSQLAFVGHPIVGDTKYGSKTTVAGHDIKLCATALSFDVATGKERKTVSIELPLLAC
jgi:23S rRNA pseudouridine1911/1915/1917 synthase